MIKKLSLSLIAAVFFALLSPTSQALVSIEVINPFSDLAVSHINYDAIQYLSDEGVLQGYEDGTFKPDQNINRAEFLKVLIEGRGITPADDLYGNCFPDVTNQWFAKYVCYAKIRGWVQGYEDGTFRPTNNVNKVETIKMVIAIFDDFLLPEVVDTKPYVDVDISQWYARYVQAAKNHNLIEGSSLILNPTTEMTRAGVSEMTYRAIMADAEDDLIYKDDCEDVCTAPIDNFEEIAMNTLIYLQYKDMDAIAEIAHPDSGVRFSPYANISMTSDVVLTAEELRHITSDTTVRTWGAFDGSGMPINLTFNQYYDKFIYDHDYVNADTTTVNGIVGSGSLYENMTGIYPNASYVEYHFAGFNPEYEGMDWAALRLIFDQKDGDWYLVGVMHDSWTI